MEVVFRVSEFISVLNSSLEYTFSYITIEGELAEYRVSKNKWVYFKLKDDKGILNCFGNIYMLPGPLEEGMLVRVTGSPRHHFQYGFSFNVESIQATGEGSLKRAQELLNLKLKKEGLFEADRKRPLPIYPETVGLITSKGSAAESDFIKIINERWGGLEIIRRDCLVQGVRAPEDIVLAIKEFNELPKQPDVLVIIRGGGSQDDLFAFSDERVVRAVCASRIPTLVGIGHEIDESLAELAADVRASTPTNAAQILVPDRQYVIGENNGVVEAVGERMLFDISRLKEGYSQSLSKIDEKITDLIRSIKRDLVSKSQLLNARDPRSALKAGYAIVRGDDGGIVSDISKIVIGDIIDIEFKRGKIRAKVASKSPK